jgi:hypothetical protein
MEGLSAHPESINSDKRDRSIVKMTNIANKQVAGFYNISYTNDEKGKTSMSIADYSKFHIYKNLIQSLPFS